MSSSLLNICEQVANCNFCYCKMQNSSNGNSFVQLIIYFSIGCMIDAYLWGRVRETERTSKANISHALPRNMQVGGSFSQKKKKWRSWVFYSMKPCETIQRASHLYSFSIDFSCAKLFNSLPGVSIFFAIS